MKEQIKIIKSIDCSNEQVDKKDSKKSENTSDPYFITFQIDLDGIKDHFKLRTFSRYCCELARRFFNFKGNLNSLPSDFDMAEYRSCEQKMLDVLYCEISRYSAQFKLKGEETSSEK